MFICFYTQGKELVENMLKIYLLSESKKIIILYLVKQ